MPEQLFSPPEGFSTLIHVTELAHVIGILKNGPVIRTRALESDFGPGFYCFSDITADQLKFLLDTHKSDWPSMLVYHVEDCFLRHPYALDLRGKDDQWQDMVKAHKLFLQRPAAMYTYQAIIGPVSRSPRSFMEHRRLSDRIDMLTWPNGKRTTQVAIRCDTLVKDQLDRPQQRVVIYSRG